MFVLALLGATESQAEEPHTPPRVTAPAPSDAPPASMPAASPSSGETDPSGMPIADYQTRRYEPAGFPLLGGNSDIGFQFGVVGTLTKFGDGAIPYVWNMDLVLAASVKGGPAGTELAQQKYSLQIDIPHVLDNVRTTPMLAYSRTVDSPYFGRGNANQAVIPAQSSGQEGRFFQFLAREVRFRSPTRLTIKRPYYAMLAPTFRFEDPVAYEGSRLALDAQTVTRSGAPLIRGLHSAPVAGLAGGLVIDSRDNEFFPHRGMFHQVGVRYVQGFPLDGDIQYGGAGVNLAGYVPLGGPFVFAGRAVADFEFGRVPFYDLFMGGPFNSIELPGGPNGIRGVPIGRYSGLVKVVGNAEIRAMLLHFHFLDQRFRIGGATFFDAGRVFDEYSFHAPRDGRGIGLKYGVGAGTYIQWGDAAVFRIELAYSPDAVAENPGFPFGLYVEDGVMF
ncbi:hypothetical protein AKJ09_05562 [Labilithrix luteola]|uniref:Bacterial surface antigen (D15) domain-containing protein n=1 Tax=Labilithrix luteola TaxID=1391654 RepID=A0A0K1PZE4_9BACT|nr:hypothetical protein AKJ09_05562 [Labilithrix luteola]